MKIALLTRRTIFDLIKADLFSFLLIPKRERALRFLISYLASFGGSFWCGSIPCSPCRALLRATDLSRNNIRLSICRIYDKTPLISVGIVSLTCFVFLSEFASTSVFATTDKIATNSASCQPAVFSSAKLNKSL